MKDEKGRTNFNIHTFHIRSLTHFIRENVFISKIFCAVESVNMSHFLIINFIHFTHVTTKRDQIEVATRRSSMHDENSDLPKMMVSIKKRQTNCFF